MGIQNSFFTVISRCVAMLTVIIVCAFSAGFNAYAFNEDYINDEYAWVDCNDVINCSFPNFDGSLKYISNTESGCMYIKLHFYDKRIDDESCKNVAIDFTISNSERTYSFSVDRNGFVDTGENEQKNIKIYYNFDGITAKKKGGDLYVGFEFKNSTDKKLNNSITCEYACGYDRTYVLFDDFDFDMHNETTSKIISTTRQKTVSRANTASTDNKRYSSADSSTKFTAAKKYTTASKSSSNNSKSEATKYTYSGSTLNDFDSPEASDDTASVENTSGININESKTVMSKQSKLVITFAVILVIVGLGFVVSGIIKKSNDNSDEAE